MDASENEDEQPSTSVKTVKRTPANSQHIIEMFSGDFPGSVLYSFHFFKKWILFWEHLSGARCLSLSLFPEISGGDPAANVFYSPSHSALSPSAPGTKGNRASRFPAAVRERPDTDMLPNTMGDDTRPAKGGPQFFSGIW
ncbi:hypothetical protein QQF64_034312 [Cirrhinus molitorella]|uniref:Uncharacterized protein n=1 Tax=Cirrhinus molitorella TaxID=172907 RepID=A0ABR3L1J2_9TELE